MSKPDNPLEPAAAPITGAPVFPPAWRWVSERGLQVQVGACALERYAALVSQNFPELEDVVPADGSLLLVLRRGAGVSAALRQALMAPMFAGRATAGRLHEIMVDYGGDAGPDLPALADRAGMDVSAYVMRQAAVEYTVAFVGFQPGFPYLSGLPPELHAPRRASPRERVAAGSLAVGGGYCGMYPADGPGGWQIIGRTAAVLFDSQRSPPALLLPGDRVRFVAR